MHNQPIRKKVGRVKVLFSAHCLTILYIFMQFNEITYMNLKLQSKHDFQTENHKVR